MSTSLAAVAHASTKGNDAVIDILVAAFEDDAAVRMLYPEDAAYGHHFPAS